MSAERERVLREEGGGSQGRGKMGQGRSKKFLRVRNFFFYINIFFLKFTRNETPPPLCDSPIHREGERGKGCSVKGKTSWEKGLEEEGVGELHGLLSLATRQVKKNISL